MEREGNKRVSGRGDRVEGSVAFSGPSSWEGGEEGRGAFGYDDQ